MIRALLCDLIGALTQPPRPSRLTMEKDMKKTTLTALACSMAVLLAAGSCESDATIASRNISAAADQFEVNRRIVFYNGITDAYLLTIEGRCSVETSGTGNTLFVTCKTGPDDFVKHFLGISDNVTWFAEQLEGIDVSVFHHRIIFKPQSILPDVDFVGDASELLTLTP